MTACRFVDFNKTSESPNQPVSFNDMSKRKYFFSYFQFVQHAPVKYIQLLYGMQWITGNLSQIYLQCIYSISAT